MRRCILLIMSVFIAVVSFSLTADTLFMRDGRKFEGRALAETADRIMFDAYDSNGTKTRMMVSRADVDRLIRAAYQAPKPAAPAVKPAQPAAGPMPAPPANASAPAKATTPDPAPTVAPEPSAPPARPAPAATDAPDKPANTLVFHADPPRQPELRLNIEEMERELGTEGKETPAAARYRGKYIEVTGVIDSVSVDSGMCIIYVSRGGKFDIFSVQCIMGKDQVQRGRAVTPGQRIVICGTYNSTTPTLKSMDGCTITGLGPDPAIRMSAEQLSSIVAADPKASTKYWNKFMVLEGIVLPHATSGRRRLRLKGSSIQGKDYTIEVYAVGSELNRMSKVPPGTKVRVHALFGGARGDLVDMGFGRLLEAAKPGDTPAPAAAVDAPLPPSPPAAPAKSMADLAGRYEMVLGSPSAPFQIIQTLELRADGTHSYSRRTRNASTGEVREKKATGTWRVEGHAVKVVLEKAEDGTAIPADRGIIELTASAATADLQVPPSNGSGAFVRQKN